MPAPLAPPSLDADPVPLLAGLTEARARTLWLVDGLSDSELESVHSPLMSPLVWDLGHIAAFEDLWLVHRLGREPMERADLAEVYDAFETPRAGRGELPFLSTDEAREYLTRVRERVAARIERRGVGDGQLHELVIRHEHQHNETMLQTLNLARLGRSREGDSGAVAKARATANGRLRPVPTGLELVEVPGGQAEIGAPVSGFAYDNERPRQRVQLPGFYIGRTPITNATFLSFVEGGGYERRELWSEEAWRWKEDHDISRPLNWTDDGREWRLDGTEALHPHKPVAHVSWFEADAFARAHDARLATEAEWEKAATWDRETATARPYPWGEQPPDAARANLDQLSLGTEPVDARPAGRSPVGCLDILGNVWEWTASRFGGYPGFTAHPYPEYSEAFFGGDYRVLRGGSWATRARVATPSFRNWDHPGRRQIFAGLRIARDL